MKQNKKGEKKRLEGEEFLNSSMSHLQTCPPSHCLGEGEGGGGEGRRNGREGKEDSQTDSLKEGGKSSTNKQRHTVIVIMCNFAMRKTRKK